jgi:multidrug resistance efflux pump
MTSQPVSAPAAPPAEVPVHINPVKETAGALVTANGPSRPPSRLPKARRWSKRTKILLGAGLALFGILFAWLSYFVITRSKDVRADLVTHKVHYSPLEFTIVERGALESANNHDIVCRVKAKNQQTQTSTTIKWIIDDGTQVVHDRPKEEAKSIIVWDAKNRSWQENESGPNGFARVVEDRDEKTGRTIYSDLLAELDDSGLIEQLKDQKIVVDKAQSDWIQAREVYNVKEEQYTIDKKTAETNLTLAKIDLEKYLKGDFPQALQDVEGRVKVAESDLEQQRDRAAWAQRMLKKGYYTVSQSDSEQSRLQSLELALAKVKTERKLLTEEDYGDKKRKTTDYENKVTVAKAALSQVEGQWKATKVQFETDRDTKKSIYDQGEAKYNDIISEIKKCRLAAPQDGLAVYYVAEQTRWGIGRQALVAQGESVAENQKLMQIPDLKHMFVNAKIHEAFVRRVHKGQEASVRVDATGNRKLRAHVESVANTPSQQDWFAADVKVYATKVGIDEEVEGLKPGMNSEVTITVADALQHVLTMPITAVFGSTEMGPKRACLVLTANGPEEREIEIGMSNEKDVEVRSGVKEGEEVVINPVVLVGKRAKTREAGEFSKKESNGGDSGYKDGKGGAPGKGGPPGTAPGGRGGPGPQAGGPGAGQPGGGPGGPAAAGKGDGAGGFQMTPEQRQQMQKQQKEFKDKYDKAKTKEEKKKIVKEQLDKVPEAYREMAKQRMKDQGLEVGD